MIRLDSPGIAPAPYRVKRKKRRSSSKLENVRPQDRPQPTGRNQKPGEINRRRRLPAYFPGPASSVRHPRRSSMRCLPRHPPRLRLTQPCPWQHPAFAPPFGSTAPPVIRVISSVGTGLCVPAWSGRTLARAPKATFPASPLKFRTSGFPGSGFKRQAPPQEFGAVPSATSATLKADPAMPVATSRVCAALSARQHHPSSG